MMEAGFWDNPEKGQEVSRELSVIREQLEQLYGLAEKIEEQEVLLELSKEENDSSVLKEAYSLQEKTEKELQDLRLKTLFSGQYDGYNAIVAFHPGAGGTESQDWAEMLFRMYLRYFERMNWKADILDMQPGEEAGLKSATVLVQGSYAYGTLKGEKGVHRLVRISPFDASGRRHTSFASLDVIPDVEEEVEVELDPGDLKIETYRSSGAGGQHVNKTDSAVRITHVPSGTVVQCQNERSQHKNKATAMRIVKSKLVKLEQEEQDKMLTEIRGEQKDIAWGSQIRSYVFHPYSLVKDLRTGVELGNIQAVMDGHLDPLIQGYLQWLAEGGKNDA